MRKLVVKKRWVFLCGIILLMMFFYIGNNWIEVTSYNIKIRKLPSEFEKFRIVHLSDVHNKMFGDNQMKLVSIVEEENPDIIMITGDLIDRRRYNKENAMILVRKLVKIAPVYYVTGNHEWWSGKYIDLKKDLVNEGVLVLSDEKVEIERKGKKISVIGIDDLAKYCKECGETSREYELVDKKIDALLNSVREDQVTILLSHRPEMFDLNKEKNLDLILCGHTHGGQVRVPFVGGILAPNQGFLPEYDAGEYKYKEVNMIINRGLGNSLAPIRIFNRPEVGVITLTKNRTGD